MPILESRGVFWWHDEAIPDGRLFGHLAETAGLTDNVRS
jgi:hypothetical protein